MWNKIILLILANITLVFFAANIYAQKTQDIDEQELANEAYKESSKEILPMTPEQIHSFKDKIKETEEAIKFEKPPTVDQKSKKIMLQPGSSAPVIKIAPGYVSSIAFYDLTGQPWPLSSVTVGDQNAYKVEVPELEPKNILTISSLEKFANSNLVVTLKDHSMPVSIQLQTDIDQAESTDSMVAFRADKRGPNAKDPTVGPSFEPSIDDIMISFLDFVPPNDAEHLESSEDISSYDIWSLDGKYYVRTKHTIVWPAYKQIASGVSGVRVYQLPKVPEIILSRNGKKQNVRVEKHD